TGFTEIASLVSGGLASDTDIYAGGLSGDGRYVAMDATYFADPLWPGGFAGALVHDRLTGVTEHIDLDTNGDIHPNELYPILSRDGHVFAFLAGGPSKSLFLRQPDLSVTGNDLTGDGDQSDIVLETIDTAGVPPGTATPTLVCPAGQVAVAHGR